MREVQIERDRDWLVVTVTRFRRDKPPAVRRMYLSADEAALVVELLKKELPPVETFRAGEVDAPRSGPIRCSSPDRNILAERIG